MVVSGETNTLTANLTVGRYPATPVVDSLNGDIYVPNAGSDTVSVISGANNSLIGTIQVGVNPWAPVFDSTNGDVYVPNLDDGTVSVISGAANSVIATIPVGSAGAFESVFDPTNGDIYVSVANNAVAVISGDSNTLIANLTMPGGPSQPLFDPANGEVYVPCLVPRPTPTTSSSNVVSVISGTTNTVIANVTIGSFPPFSPGADLYDSANGDIYVSDFADFSPGTVSVISGANNSVIATIPVSPGPSQLAFDPDNGDIYVQNVYVNPGGPLCPNYGPCFPEEGFVDVDVISGANNTVVANVNGLPFSPGGALFDPLNGDVYISGNYVITGGYALSIAVISGSTNAVVAGIATATNENAPEFPSSLVALVSLAAISAAAAVSRRFFPSEVNGFVREKE
jgi:YVTN family beta-propeller protein